MSQPSPTKKLNLTYCYAKISALSKGFLHLLLKMFTQSWLIPFDRSQCFSSLCGWHQFDIFLFSSLRPSYLTPIKICQVFSLPRAKSFEDIKYLQSSLSWESQLMSSKKPLSCVAMARIWLFSRYAIYSKWKHELFIEWKKNKFYWLREASGGKYTPKIIFLNFSRSKIYVAQCRKTHRKKINIMKFNGLKGKKKRRKIFAINVH